MACEECAEASRESWSFPVTVLVQSRQDDQEENVDNLVQLGEFFMGLGIFLVGIGVLYGVSVWAKK